MPTKNKKKFTSPNETRGSESDLEELANKEQSCPECGMSREGWKGNEGQGIRKDDAAYCCEGCADLTGLYLRRSELTPS